MFYVHNVGSFAKTEAFLAKLRNLDSVIMAEMNRGGQEGVDALSRATPIETGLAAKAWYYEATASRGVYTLSWFNSDVENGFPVVIMLQYGHGTGTGGYVSGRDFINPAIKPIFDKIANNIWKAVTSA